MGSSIFIGKIWGVPIRLNFSWFLIFGLVTWSLASGYYPEAYPMLSTSIHWILGAVTALAFAASVLLHELGHVRVALRNGIPVRGVSLFIFGGVAEMEKEPNSPGAEFRIAAAGPLVSLVLAGLFALLWRLDREVPILAAPSEYLFRINLMLGLFNLIPGFPLDGGRILRSLVWKLTGSMGQATRFASGAGQLVSLGFFAVGIFYMLQGNVFNGLWLAFIGWFLQNAASSAYTQSGIQEKLSGTRVEQIMEKSLDLVPGLTTLDQIVNERAIHSGQNAFLIDDGGTAKGILTLHEIAAVPQRKWPFTTARQVMQPIGSSLRLAPEMELLTALQQMHQADTRHATVIQQNQVIGLLTQEDIFRYLRVRSQHRM